MTEHDYKARVAGTSVWFIDADNWSRFAFIPDEAAAEHFAAKLNAPDLTAEVVELRQANGGLRASAESAIAERRRLTAEVERLTAERDHYADLWAQTHSDPEAPPIPCVEVEPTDGRRTWRAMGEDVRTLGDEWEGQYLGRSSFAWEVAEGRWIGDDEVHLIRRTIPPAPRTVTVELPIDVARRFANPLADLRFTAYDEAAIIDGCRAALTEDGDR